MGTLAITWINPERVVVEGGLLTAQRVDVRLRSILPGAALSRRGHKVDAVAMGDLGVWERRPGAYEAEVYVIGKALQDVSAVARRIREGKGKVILDLCDNVFEPPEDGPRPFTEALLPLVNGVVTSTEMLREAVERYLPRGIPVTTIPDCVEGTRQMPQFAPTLQPLKLLWFGYWNNLVHVHRLLPHLAKLGVPVELTLVSRWNWQVRMGLDGNPHGVQTRLVEWSWPVMAAELARTDMVVVPSSREQTYQTRSPNRIITALWAGRYVVAYPLPSYRPFEGFAGIGEDLTAKILEAVRDPEVTQARIAAGQTYIASHFWNDTIGARWEGFAQRVMAGT